MLQCCLVNFQCRGVLQFKCNLVCLKFVSYFFVWVNNVLRKKFHLVVWLVVLGLTALSDNISVYIGPSPRVREKEKRIDR